MRTLKKQRFGFAMSCSHAVGRRGYGTHRPTVEGHIDRAIAKTGTTCRHELAALLPRDKLRSQHPFRSRRLWPLVESSMADEHLLRAPLRSKAAS